MCYMQAHNQASQSTEFHLNSEKENAMNFPVYIGVVWLWNVHRNARHSGRNIYSNFFPLEDIKKFFFNYLMGYKRFWPISVTLSKRSWQKKERFLPSGKADSKTPILLAQTKLSDWFRKQKKMS